MNAFDNVPGLATVAGTAVHGLTIIRVRIVLNGCVTVGASEHPVDAGLLFGRVYVVAVTFKALGVLLRMDRWRGEYEANDGHQGTTHVRSSLPELPRAESQTGNDHTSPFHREAMGI
jgi:hypothetical protein